MVWLCSLSQWRALWEELGQHLPGKVGGDTPEGCPIPCCSSGSGEAAEEKSGGVCWGKWRRLVKTPLNSQFCYRRLIFLKQVHSGVLWISSWTELSCLVLSAVREGQLCRTHASFPGRPFLTSFVQTTKLEEKKKKKRPDNIWGETRRKMEGDRELRS